MLLLEGENTGPGALRNADDLVISNEEFQRFLERHKAHNPVAEDNDAMENSYLLLDEEMRYISSPSLLPYCLTPCTLPANITGFSTAKVERRYRAAAFSKSACMPRSPAPAGNPRPSKIAVVSMTLEGKSLLVRCQKRLYSKDLRKDFEVHDLHLKDRRWLRTSGSFLKLDSIA